MLFTTEHMAIFAGGVTGIWKGIGIGLVLNSSPFTIGTLTALGSISSATILFFSGDKLRNTIFRMLGKKNMERKKGKFQHWLQKYGTAVLGLFATGPLGPFVPLLLALMILKETRRFFFFLLIGIVIWSFVFAYFGSTLIQIISSFKTI